MKISRPQKRYCVKLLYHSILATYAMLQVAEIMKMLSLNLSYPPQIRKAWHGTSTIVGIETPLIALKTKTNT